MIQKIKFFFFIQLLLRIAYFLIDNNLRLRNDAASLRNNIQAMRDNDPVHYIKKKRTTYIRFIYKYVAYIKLRTGMSGGKPNRKPKPSWRVAFVDNNGKKGRAITKEERGLWDKGEKLTFKVIWECYYCQARKKCKRGCTGGAQKMHA